MKRRKEGVRGEAESQLLNSAFQNRGWSNELPTAQTRGDEAISYCKRNIITKEDKE
jgi:hypothetical protein